MRNGLTEYPRIEIIQLAAVDAALKRIDPDCYIGLYAEIIRKELERALYDQLFGDKSSHILPKPTLTNCFISENKCEL